MLTRQRHKHVDNCHMMKMKFVLCRGVGHQGKIVVTGDALVLYNTATRNKVKLLRYKTLLQRLID